MGRIADALKRAEHERREATAGVVAALPGAQTASRISESISPPDTPPPSTGDEADVEPVPAPKVEDPTPKKDEVKDTEDPTKRLTAPR